MKSFDQWFEEQGQDKPETDCQDGDGWIYAELSKKAEAVHIEEVRAQVKQKLADYLNSNPGLQWRGYGRADKPDPDDPYPQAGECCRCGATTEFHDGNFFYCGGSPRCCP